MARRSSPPRDVRDGEQAYNPVVTMDGWRWRDFEFTTEGEAGEAIERSDDEHRDWFDRSGRPPPLDEARPYGVRGGLARPDPQCQADLAHAVPRDADGRPLRFPDPRGRWAELLNGEGVGADPFRAGNAVDCALAALSTWHGEPAVAAPRHPEYEPGGRPALTGERGGVVRAEQWLGHRFEYVGHGPGAYLRIAQWMIEGGAGGAAVIINRWPSGGSHAWNVFNVEGEIVWADLQLRTHARQPLYLSVTGVFCVAVDRFGRRLC